ncbi:hypothetical protein E2C01_068931 [Portunus trituberculatus]|uniref:Uncharacterized protein n=1 Tax=Portunus trituberculatus TaxID=210409 RepID=A0A5B7HZ93_PORTR|nr:hypothetical protein [Portunus trituberculatus]
MTFVSKNMRRHNRPNKMIYCAALRVPTTPLCAPLTRISFHSYSLAG